MKFRVMRTGLGLPPQEVNTIEAPSREDAEELLRILDGQDIQAARLAGMGHGIEDIKFTLEPVV